MPESGKRSDLQMAIKAFYESESDVPGLDDLLWEELLGLQKEGFRTAKGLEFSYEIRGYEMFVDRKEKSITRATVNMAFHRALELQRGGGRVSGPKKLGTFGASYLYPIFISIGAIG